MKEIARAGKKVLIKECGLQGGNRRKAHREDDIRKGGENE